ncbi:hypothetical protein ACS127_02550 [Amphibacillus sp. Q70]|uniref:hypothetical protein n=1 Tax=Amphibacillus sp. Q70 TaxID=3453416 RepID=UPI003F87B663
MLIPTIIMGWLGVLLFLIIAVTFPKMAKNNEFAFIHILMALMHGMWLPLPLTIYQLLNIELLQVGTLFGFVYLMLMVVTMTLQTGHIAYIVKQNDDQAIIDEYGNYMMATLSNPFECLAMMFKCVWALFLGLSFLNSEEVLMAGLMFLFSLFFFYYLAIVIDTSLVKRVKFFSKVKPNTWIINLETMLFLIILMSYITFH